MQAGGRGRRGSTQAAPAAGAGRGLGAGCSCCSCCCGSAGCVHLRSTAAAHGCELQPRCCQVSTDQVAGCWLSRAGLAGRL